MGLLIGRAMIVGVVALLIATSWMRGRSGSSGVEPWMLRVEWLTGLCSGYLDYIDHMNDGGHDEATLYYLVGRWAFTIIIY
ncbi:hypothetical protein EYB53_019665 [Candidatus Chloroploca sp. M-50]|uniref:Uncharacterized protein n=1 Tax=Candidatus Chloroploca mongolica TaxID=2528176 RepID=A0ABS4DER7_9CHLR|nr:hypothetical protein [Candidatus Chloroploca mongolica]MBP1467944.1 hypothetical protein [Candidatus Chloroploca mongolica]